MSEQKKPEPRRINIEIPADLAATYSNLAVISHSPWEFFLDFAQIMPNMPQQARVRARVIIAPTNAKMLLRALEENIARYELQYGEIPIPARPPSLADQLFNSLRSDGEEGPKEGGPKDG